MSHAVFCLRMKASMKRRASARLANECRYNHCSFNVRRNRSMTPLHSGSPA